MTTVDLSWKLRAQKAEAQLKAAQQEHASLQKSYADVWERAEAAETLVGELRTQLEQTQKELQIVGKMHDRLQDDIGR